MRHLFWIYGTFLISTVSHEVNGEQKTPIPLMTQITRCLYQDNFSLYEAGCAVGRLFLYVRCLWSYLRERQ